MKRRRSTSLLVGDKVQARVIDDWLPGQVCRSIARGAEVDVRLLDGRVMRSLTAKDVRKAKEADDEG